MEVVTRLIFNKTMFKNLIEKNRSYRRFDNSFSVHLEQLKKVIIKQTINH